MSAYPRETPDSRRREGAASAMWAPAPTAGTEPDPAPILPMTMPAPPEQAAREIKEEGVEGKPADASSGPGMLMAEMGLIIGGVVVLAALIGLLVDWGLGLAALVLGLLAIALNPVFGATAMRVRDRKVVADHELGRDAIDPSAK